MAWLWLLLAGAALVATALAGAAALRLRPLSFLLAAYLLASGELVLLGEVLSLLQAANAAGYAVGEALPLAGALAVWHARGRPRPPTLPGVDRAAVTRHPVVAALGAIVGVAVAYELFIVLGTPPNNWDSMTYHLARIAYWLQEQSVLHFDAGTARQLAQPPNGEFLQGWALAVTDSDRFAAVVQ